MSTTVSFEARFRKGFASVRTDGRASFKAPLGTAAQLGAVKAK